MTQQGCVCSHDTGQTKEPLDYRSFESPPPQLLSSPVSHFSLRPSLNHLLNQFSPVSSLEKLKQQAVSRDLPG